MFAPTDIACSFRPRRISKRSGPLSGMARAPNSRGDTQAGGGVSHRGRMRPTTKSAPVESIASMMARTHPGSGSTSSSVQARIGRARPPRLVEGV